MGRHLLVFLLTLYVIIAHTKKTEEEYQQLWQQFRVDFSDKVYATGAEELSRYNIFKSNVDVIDKLNDDYGPQTEFGINQFADWSHEEYKRLVSSVHKTQTKKTHSKRGSVDERERIQSLFSDILQNRIPTSVDWREKGVVTPISDQGTCGSSPYFAGITSVEGAWAIAGNKLIPLSVQQVVDCTDGDDWGNYGCNGGYMNETIAYAASAGIEANTSYPYTATDGTCKFDASDVYTKVKGVVNVPSNDDALTAAVAIVPVATAIYAAAQSFEFYKSGIYNDPICETDVQPDHGIAVVGYGVDSSGTNYYILKNWWDVTWGIEGYMMLIRNGKNPCGVATYASYAYV